MDLEEVGWEGMDWIHLAWASDRWRALAKVVLTFVFHKMLGISGLEEELSASQEGLWSMELATLLNRSVFTSAQHLFSLITIGLHVSTVIQSSSGPSQWL